MTWDGIPRVWLHLTDAEAFSLAMGKVPEPVRAQCEQLLREPEATLRANAAKPTRKKAG